MVLYHKWDVKNGFAYVLQFFSLISNGLGGVGTLVLNIFLFVKMFHWVESKILSIFHNDVSLQMLKNSIVFYSTISPNSVLKCKPLFSLSLKCLCSSQLHYIRLNKITVTKFFQQILSAVAMENKIWSNFFSFAKNPVKQKPSHYYSWH